MHFITLIKLRGRPTKERLQQLDKIIENPPEGTKIRFVFWTLGRYDLVIYTEGPDEATALSTVLPFFDFASTETLVAITKEDAHKLII
ncbi:MAG: GYD domain-containing protein [Candidatus Methylarchaceae archaeon HK02M2]|nr:GYD domain-containing protein [Candidatus Methylarchaceae archaeon HK02M2]